MRKYQSLTAATLAILLSALAGGVFGRSALATEDPARSLQDVYCRARRDSAPTTRSRSNPIGSSTAPSTACCRRSIRIRASWIRSRTRACASSRRAATIGLGLSIVTIDGDITISRVFEGSPAYQQGVRRGDVIARSKARAQRAGPPTKPCANCAARKGTFVNVGIRRKGPRRADPDARHARRDQHSERQSRVHDRLRKPAT